MFINWSDTGCLVTLRVADHYRRREGCGSGPYSIVVIKHTMLQYKHTMYSSQTRRKRCVCVCGCPGREYRKLAAKSAERTLSARHCQWKGEAAVMKVGNESHLNCAPLYTHSPHTCASLRDVKHLGRMTCFFHCSEKEEHSVPVHWYMHYEAAQTVRGSVPVPATCSVRPLRLRGAACRF